MTTLYIDFETRSTVDLKTAGLDNYAKHPTTDAWCIGAAFDDEQVFIVTPDNANGEKHVLGGERGMYDLCQHVRDGGIVVAHNAQFELAIWNHIMVPRYGWPALKPEQCRCTMAAAYAMALPGSLEKAAAAVGLEAQKDKSGHRLMMQMASPRSMEIAKSTQCPECFGEGHHMIQGEFPVPCRTCKGRRVVGTPEKITWWDDADKLQALYDYCRQDVKVERELYKRLQPLSDSEQAMWVLDQKINNRGIHVDRPSVHKAIAVVQAEADRLNNAMREVTGNVVGFCSETARLGKWVRSRGVAVDGVAKADIGDALADEALPADVRKALLIRQEAGKTSTAKLRAMIDAVSEDGRLRGMLQYHGAATGRWAGRRVQLQNIPRWPDDFDEDDAEQVLAVLATLPADRSTAFLQGFYGSPMTIVSYLLRPLLCAAPGHELLAADFANIEGRGLAWLAGEETKLDYYRAYDSGEGPDIYKVTAGKILGMFPGEITKEQRQTYGKVPELACGYQGGLGAFKKMGGKVDDAKAQQIVDAWRAEHPAIVSYWYDLDAAFKNAIRQKGMTTSAGAAGREVRFRVKGSFLWCQLPSKRLLCYPYPRIDTAHTFQLEDGRIKKLSARALARDGAPKDAEETRVDHGAAFYMHVDGLSNKWVETDTYGGKLSENVTQAVCRDLLAEAIKRVEYMDYPVVLHVHDEVVSELPAGHGDLAEFELLCAETPAWAGGLPVVASGWRGRRYRK